MSLNQKGKNMGDKDVTIARLKDAIRKFCEDEKDTR